MQLDRPKFENFDPGNYPNKDQFDVCEVKMDGWWGQLVIKGTQWKLYSRTGMLKKEGSLRRSYNETLLHGEYCYGTEWSKGRPDLYNKLAAFDAIQLDGESVEGLTNGDVNSMLGIFVEDVLSVETIVSGVFVLPQFPIEHAARVWEEMVVQNDCEGLVFKHSQQPWGYGFGRMKRRETMDYVCMGVEESDSDTYRGWGVASILGGLYVDGELKQVCKVSGLSDDIRKELFDNRDSYLYCVFEAEGKKISKKGALRHPNFLRWRDDKLPEDCKWPR